MEYPVYCRQGETGLSQTYAVLNVVTGEGNSSSGTWIDKPSDLIWQIARDSSDFIIVLFFPFRKWS